MGKKQIELVHNNCGKFFTSFIEDTPRVRAILKRGDGIIIKKLFGLPIRHSAIVPEDEIWFCEESSGKIINKLTFKQKKL